LLQEHLRWGFKDYYPIGQLLAFGDSWCMTPVLLYKN
jgi:hypothetical protein